MINQTQTWLLNLYNCKSNIAIFAWAGGHVTLRYVDNLYKQQLQTFSQCLPWVTFTGCFNVTKRKHIQKADINLVRLQL